MIGGDGSLAREAARCAAVLQTFPASVTPMRALLRALRPQLWVKNLLVLIPLFASRTFDEPASVMSALAAMITFSLCASSVYLLNDLIDLDADRSDDVKSSRPFAAGDLSIQLGVAVTLPLLAGSLALALLVSTMLVVALTGHVALALLYSWLLKGRPLVHELAITGLYLLRIIAGAAAIEAHLSSWLLSFFIPLFLSVSFAKRHTEVRLRSPHDGAPAITSDYTIDDAPILQTVGVAAGGLCVVVLAIYAQSPEAAATFSRPAFIWPVCTLTLYWIVWLWAGLSKLNEDPFIAAIKDPKSWIVAVLASAMMWLAL